jgi:hypothetical protein
MLFFLISKMMNVIHVWKLIGADADSKLLCTFHVFILLETCHWRNSGFSRVVQSHTARLLQQHFLQHIFFKRNWLSFSSKFTWPHTVWCIAGENIQRINVSESCFLQHCSAEGTGFVGNKTCLTIRRGSKKNIFYVMEVSLSMCILKQGEIFTFTALDCISG